MVEETKTCINCGMVNDIGVARCVQCSNPLTAYGGQVNNSEKHEGNLAAQVALLEKRPVIVSVVAGFSVFFALFWPLAYVIGSFTARVKVSEDQMNYLAASFGSLGVIFSAIALIPLAIVLVIVAWGTFTQRAWGWYTSLGSMGVFLFWTLVHFRAAPFFSFVWVVAMISGAVLWFKRDVKAWYVV